MPTLYWQLHSLNSRIIFALAKSQIVISVQFFLYMYKHCTVFSLSMIIIINIYRYMHILDLLGKCSNMMVCIFASWFRLHSV